MEVKWLSPGLSFIWLPGRIRPFARDQISSKVKDFNAGILQSAKLLGFDSPARLQLMTTAWLNGSDQAWETVNFGTDTNSFQHWHWQPQHRCWRLSSHIFCYQQKQSRDKLSSQEKERELSWGELDKRIRTHINTPPGTTSQKLDLSGGKSKQEKNIVFLIRGSFMPRLKRLDDWL